MFEQSPPFLLASVALLLLLPAVVVQSVQDFTGPGTVRCPVFADYQLHPCAPSFLGGNPLACITTGGAASCLSNFTLPDFTTSAPTAVLVPIPCACLVALNCADSCTLQGAANATATSTATPTPTVTAPPTPTTASVGLDFVGPGTVTCPSADYVVFPCAVDFLPTCPDVAACATDSASPPGTSTADPSIVTFGLACDCYSVTACPATCTFVAGPPTLVSNATTMMTADANATDFTGPGYLTCPADEYASRPCDTIGFLSNCTVDVASCQFDAAPIIDANQSDVLIPLPCACLTAFGCPSSCVLSSGKVPTTGVPPAPTGRANFTGAGVVTCHVADFIRQPCLPQIDAAACSNCSVVDLSGGLANYSLQDTTFAIPLNCPCVSLLNCPDTCTFAAAAGGAAPPNPSAAPTSRPSVAKTDAAPPGPTAGTAAPEASRKNTTAPAAPAVSAPTGTNVTQNASSAAAAGATASLALFATALGWMVVVAPWV